MQSQMKNKLSSNAESLENRAMLAGASFASGANLGNQASTSSAGIVVNQDGIVSQDVRLSGNSSVVVRVNGEVVVNETSGTGGQNISSLPRTSMLRSAAPQTAAPQTAAPQVRAPQVRAPQAPASMLSLAEMPGINQSTSRVSVVVDPSGISVPEFELSGNGRILVVVNGQEIINQSSSS